MGEAEHEGCQECGSAKQDVNMALCDTCFWAKSPSSASGAVVERRAIKTGQEATKPPAPTGQELVQSTSEERSMDPDVALMKLLDGASALAEGEMTHNEACEFANNFENLHEWLEKGGFLPAKWGGERPPS
jgi:hypothetical protein